MVSCACYGVEWFYCVGRWLETQVGFVFAEGFGEVGYCFFGVEACLSSISTRLMQNIKG